MPRVLSHVPFSRGIAYALPTASPFSWQFSLSAARSIYYMVAAKVFVRRDEFPCAVYKGRSRRAADTADRLLGVIRPLAVKLAVVWAHRGNSPITVERVAEIRRANRPR